MSPAKKKAKAKGGRRTLAADVARFLHDADTYGWRDEMLSGETVDSSIARVAAETQRLFDSGQHGVVAARIREVSEDGTDDVIDRAEDLLARIDSIRPRVVSMSPKSKAYGETGGRMLRQDFAAGKVRFRPVPYEDSWAAYVQGDTGCYRLVIDAGTNEGRIMAPGGGPGVNMERTLFSTSAPLTDPTECGRALVDALKGIDRARRNIGAGEYYASCR